LKKAAPVSSLTEEIQFEDQEIPYRCRGWRLVLSRHAGILPAHTASLYGTESFAGRSRRIQYEYLRVRNQISPMNWINIGNQHLKTSRRNRLFAGSEVLKKRD
jgi:hypothetical protein